MGEPPGEPDTRPAIDLIHSDNIATLAVLSHPTDILFHPVGFFLYTVFKF